SAPISSCSSAPGSRPSATRPRRRRLPRWRRKLMRPAELEAMLRRVRRGTISPARAAREIAEAPLENLGFATLDHQRSLRVGFPEVVFGQGKTPEHLVEIVGRLYRRSGVVLATRVPDEGRRALAERFPEARVHDRARAVVLRRRPARPRGGILVVCAGTADLPVAEE